MTIDLTKAELELLDEALKCWQEEPRTEGIGVGLISALMRGKDQSKEQLRSELEARTREMTLLVRARERRGLLLRAKLMQAENRQSEHDVP